MKKRYMWMLFPAVLLPYLTLSALVVVFYSTKVPFCRMIMEHVFRGNGLWLIALVLLFGALSVICGIIFFVTSIRSKWEPVSMAKVAMVFKLVHIPAYLLNFVLGVLLLISIFTYPITFALILLDGMMLFLSGLVSVSAVINASRRQIIAKKEAILFGVFSFVYVVDVIFAITFFVRLTKNSGGGGL